MSRKTEATSNSSNAAAATAAAASAEDAKKQLHPHTNGHTNGHSTAHDLDSSNNKDTMLTHKKRGDALLRDDEREELMMTDRIKSSKDDDKDDKSKDITEGSSGSLSGADTWNFALLVVLCTFLFLFMRNPSIAFCKLNPSADPHLSALCSLPLHCRTSLAFFSLPTHKNTSLFVICVLVVMFVVVPCCRG